MYTVENLETLWDDVRNGDDKAFASIHRKMYPDLVRYAVNLTRDEDLSDDLLQDLFIKFWQKKDQIGSIANVRSYFYKSVKLTILDHFKRVQSNEIKLGAMEVLGFEFPKEHMIIIEERNYVLENQMLMNINKLPAKQKEVIYLRFYRNLEYDQITEITGIQYQSVINNVYRAIQNLRESCPASCLYA